MHPCKWTLHNHVFWQTSCKNEVLDEWTSFGFKFCPFCGGTLEIDSTSQEQSQPNSNQED